MLKCTEVQNINIPYYKGLSIEEILEWAAGYNEGEAMEGLPITEKERLKLPREYIGNVIYTIAKDPFQNWVDEQIEARNQKVAQDHDLSIAMDPEIAKLF